ncbi:YeeE/YedE family protein [Orbus mooreae]|uniref:YeeE/YedE family protein n=1 Tax=Orbus mooreae TaxID=3074107 RepID=UPI00370D9546
MELTLNDIISGIIGGVLIGLASALIWLTLGRIAGISGILSKLFSLDYKLHAWRISFVVGLLAGG